MLLILAATSVALAGAAPVHAIVDRVVDGDTVWVRSNAGRTDVRILGIDCPESKHNAKCKRGGKAACDAEVPRGKAATVRARELLHAGDAVTLEPGGSFKSDRYGRTLAYVRLRDGRDYGLVMIREAGCADYGWKYPHPRMGEYTAAK